MLNIELPVTSMRLRHEPARLRNAAPRVRVLAGTPAACPLLLHWMPVLVPMAAVLLCACIGAIWQFVM